MSADKILDDYETRPGLAKQLKKSERTLKRWEDMRIGPPVTYIGSTAHYHVPSARAWVKACERKMPRVRTRSVRAAAGG
jgi:hypothetical protein